MVNELKNDGVTNTYCFSSAILKDGIISTTLTDINKRSGVCQVDGNNFIVLSGTTRKGYSYKDVAEIFQKLGCKTAYSLDGGDSVSIVYKKNNVSKATVQYCNDTYGESRASSKTKCRYIVEGIYFVEK